MVKRAGKNSVPLIVEDHPDDYNGYPFITLVQYRNHHVLAIVDDADDRNIRQYVLDLCGPSGVDEERVIDIATNWWERRRNQYPISFEFSRLGLTNHMSPIYKTYNIEYVTRVIGPLPRFDLTEVNSIRRRKRKPVPNGVRVVGKINTIE